MSVVLTKRHEREGGFTLIETLVALALTGLVLSALANITSQWLPNWNRGIDRIQRIVPLDELNAVAVIDGSFIAQLTLLVKNEDMRRGLWAVGLGNTLGLAVVKVGIR